MPTRCRFDILCVCRRSIRHCGGGLSSRVVQAGSILFSSVDGIGDCLSRFLDSRLCRRCSRCSSRCSGVGSAAFGAMELLGDTLFRRLRDFGGKRGLGRGEVSTCCFQRIRGRRLECGDYTTCRRIGWCNYSGSAMKGILFLAQSRQITNSIPGQP